MDDFREVLHLVFLMKQLHSLNKFEMLKEYLDRSFIAEGEIDFDLIYEITDKVIDGMFERSGYYYNEDNGISTYVMTGNVMSEYYRFADEYGKRHGLSDENNPYVKAANDASRRWFDFSFSLGWFLKHTPESKSPYKTKLVLLMDENYDISLTGVAIGVAGMYSFFIEKGAELQSRPVKEAAAA